MNKLAIISLFALVIASTASTGQLEQLLPGVEIQYGDSVGCFAGFGRNITQEALDPNTLKTMVNHAKVAELVKDLGSIYKDVKLGQGRIRMLRFECRTVYFVGYMTSAHSYALAVIDATGTYKGKQHNFTIKVDARGSGNNTSVERVSLFVDNKHLCELLADVSYPEAIKSLQEKNLIPTETLTLKNQTCTEDEYYRIDGSGRGNPYIVAMEVVDAQNIIYKIEAYANVKHSNLPYSYNEVRNLKWDTSAAKVQNNPLFPTEDFRTDFDCKTELLTNQKVIPFDQEIPVKLFDAILKWGPIHELKELVDKKYTVSDIKVRSINTNCEYEYLLYRLTGVLTTSDGLKFKADMTGRFFSEPITDHTNSVSKLFAYFKGKNDRFYDRFVPVHREFTPMK
jgi:hypothetical protein